jgi:glycosyltransferase involved in cell wall biosynthesis
MRLVIATPLYPPEIGGPATYVRELEDGLTTFGITVEIVKFSDVKKLPKLFRHHAYYTKLVDALKRADAMLALDPVSVGLPASEAAKRLKKPFYLKIVGDYAWEQGVNRYNVQDTLDVFLKAAQMPFQVRFLKYIQTEVARRASGIIVPSKYLKRVVEAWGVSSGNISVIENAVSVGGVGVVPESIKKLPAPRLITAGRLVPWKGVAGLIRAVAALREAGINASLGIIGDGEERARLEEEAATLLTDGFVFTGRLSHEDTLATLAFSDVFVLNSTYEGLSHLLIEALLMKTPIVATDVGGNAEVITHEKDGLIVPSTDTTALVGALSRILKDEGLRALFRKNAKDVEKRFSKERMLKETARALGGPLI